MTLPNRALTQFLLACGAYLLTASSFGQPSDYKHDLVNCRFTNGIAMDQLDCQAMRKYFAAQAEKKAKNDAYIAKETAAIESDRLLRKEAEDKRKAEWTEMRAMEKLEQEARQAAYEKRRAAEDKAQASADRKAVVAVDVLKAKCGADYKKPYIGMSIDRVRACVTQVKLKGQINRADGVVSTFEGGNAYFHVMEGRVVSWGKY